MLIKVAVFGGNETLNQLFRQCIVLYQYPVFIVGRVDTANLGGFQPHQRKLCTTDMLKTVQAT